MILTIQIDSSFSSTIILLLLKTLLYLLFTFLYYLVKAIVSENSSVEVRFIKVSIDIFLLEGLSFMWYSTTNMKISCLHSVILLASKERLGEGLNGNIYTSPISTFSLLYKASSYNIKGPYLVQLTSWLNVLHRYSIV